MRYYLAFFLCLIMSIPSFSQQSKPYISLAEAKKIADAAEAKALENEWTVVIAIVDDGGHLILLRKIDGTQIGSVEVAQAKARSAVYFKRSTKVFEDGVNEGNVRMLSLPNAVALEGGLPIFKDGFCIGAIGISGVRSDQDGVIAAAGLEVLEEK
ncbi:GlcG/HbpS family heme-binding protein [Arthrospiribacter ruber]|uniref:Heme-binding protein n=1 Tax=Arthrospiribacter ruber TaxID=2487934 RepID=A0A951IY47_9BACT|nr:heme-binding protein [Arthrospiribacter ruber]MBW3469265.1 heme-binding protein [Arthrospiribacter ruber]